MAQYELQVLGDDLSDDRGAERQGGTGLSVVWGVTQGFSWPSGAPTPQNPSENSSPTSHA